jgi:hypothetical protein
MRRRVFLMAPLAGRLLAEPPEQIVDLLTSMSSGLSGGNAAAFLDAFDRSMPQFETLQANIIGLINQADLLSSIEIVSDQGDDNRRQLELDWFLQIRSKLATGPLERRRDKVTCRVERKKERWKVVSLEPVKFFAPPKV